MVWGSLEPRRALPKHRDGPGDTAVMLQAHSILLQASRHGLPPLPACFTDRREGGSEEPGAGAQREAAAGLAAFPLRPGRRPAWPNTAQV